MRLMQLHAWRALPRPCGHGLRPHASWRIPAPQVKVKKRGDDRKWLARVLAIGTECDVALLTGEHTRWVQLSRAVRSQAGGLWACSAALLRPGPPQPTHTHPTPPHPPHPHINQK